MAVLVTAAALLLLCCQHAHAFDMPGGGIPGMGGEKKCAPFRCSSGHGAVPRRPLRLTSQGCHGFGMSMYSGMGGGGDDAKSGLKPCCDLLHACYGVCGSPKARCDRNFKKCSKEACAAAATDAARKECESTSNLHGVMLQLGGCQNYDKKQADACQCVPERRVQKRRLQSLQDFFKANNKDKLAGAKKLHKKHGTADAWKFSKLLLRLVAKYPNCIQQVQSKEQQMYDEIMKGTYDKDKGAASATPNGGAGGAGADSGSGRQYSHAEDEEEEEPVPEEAQDVDGVMDLDGEDVDGEDGSVGANSRSHDEM